MSKFKIAAVISTICLMIVVLYGLVVSSQTPKSSIRLITEPPLSQILPFQAEATRPQSPVRLTLQALDEASKPLENAKIRLQILTPPKNPWFPTDFPIVEGTELLNIEAIVPKGELQIQQILPIRGNYQLLVEAKPIVADAFQPIQQIITVSVPENWVKYRNFAILAIILLVLGLVGGLVLGGKQEIKPGEIAPQRVRLLLSGAIIVAIATLLIINISAEVADSHSLHHNDQAPNSEPAVQKIEGIEAKITGDVQATVGQSAKLEVQVLNPQTNQPVTDVLMKIKATQLEDKWVAFAYEGMADVNGKLTWEEQFFDGAPHKVEVEISPKPEAKQQFSPLRVAKNIAVEGVAPPMQIRLIVLAYFTSIIVVGLLLGLRLKRKLFYVRPLT